MERFVSLLFVVLFSIVQIELCFCEFKFNDDILYGINWFEKPTEINASQTLVLKTANSEKYACQIPTNPRPKHSEYQFDAYTGPTELELVQKLIDKKICSTKESPYWFYEVCHGKHVRQYHEALETSGKPATIQEYYLGHYQNEEVSSDKKEKKKKIPQMSINSIKLPYFSLNMSSGDYCDLIGRSRSVQVLYFCHENLQANLYDFQEIRTCEYQAIVFTKYLCEHPAYKMKENFLNEISCSPLNGAPIIPRAMFNIDKEIKNSENIVSSVDSLIDSSKIEPQIKVEAYRKNGIIYYRIIQIDKNEIVESKVKDSTNKETSTTETSSDPSQDSSSNNDESANALIGDNNSNNLLSRILSGKYCIESGASYWRHRVCFLKKVSQYHVEVDFETQEIIMGFWNEEKHLKWLEDHPMMKPKFPVEERNEIYHLYSDGNFCEEINANRRAILKISCVNDNSSSVTVTVSEPNICSYIVIVKGSVFCPLVKQADENGLIKKDE